MKPEWLEAFELDSEEGPAAPLASDEAAALASKVVDRALSTGGAGLGLGMSRTFVALAGAGGVLTVLGLVYGVGSMDPACLDETCAGRAAASGASVSVVVPSAQRSAPPPLERAPLEPVPVTALPNAAAPPVSSARRSAKAIEQGARQHETPSDLLAEANRARRDREWQRAAALYDRVMSSQAHETLGPGTRGSAEGGTRDESYAATVALASLRLEHLGDPRGALALYERALSARPGGALSAQAAAGVARCRRVLGDLDPR